ncbi:hypothetical protein CLV35_3916 [Motilibacter peucedani]|uniref:Uncharacterized protein n=1 Tax=Motilibacter peucedani TaxID=598650 RepID=A0A420XJZ1_9ACTN|nr:hypothetical protein [Motilibacter peucedani]RKS68009.1 hypothetical protein CLV35_3916 [Motilibacter peucedani]
MSETPYDTAPVETPADAAVEDDTDDTAGHMESFLSRRAGADDLEEPLR